MAHLWHSTEPGGWTIRMLDEKPVSMSGVTLNQARDSWILFADPDARITVNGLPILLGIAALSDRDEICAADGTTLYFSTEALASIEPYQGTAAHGACPRCRLPIETGTQAVRCPQCALWHHESEDLPCWTYADRCAGCSCSTALGAGFRWTPEEL